MKGEIIILDAQKIYREGITSLLSSEGYTNTHGIESTHELKNCINENTQLVILDYNQQLMDKKTLASVEKKFPKVNWLLITALLNAKEIIKQAPIKIKGYLTKECPDDEIMEAISNLEQGKQFYCQQLFDHLMNNDEDDSSCEPSILTRREIQIIEKISMGLTNKEIGEIMSISHHTVHTHRKNILKKMKVSSSSEMIAQALKAKII